MTRASRVARLTQRITGDSIPIQKLTASARWLSGHLASSESRSQSTPSLNKSIGDAARQARADAVTRSPNTTLETHCRMPSTPGSLNDGSLNRENTISSSIGTDVEEMP